MKKLHAVKYEALDTVDSAYSHPGNEAKGCLFEEVRIAPTFNFVFIVMTGFETQNKYLVRNTLGQQVYFAAESEFPIIWM